MRYSPRMELPVSLYEALSSLDAGDLQSVQPMMSRGSDRSYCRLFLETGATLVVCVYGRERQENECFPETAKLLADIGLRVPAVKAHHPGDRWVLQEDVGDVTLFDVVLQQGADEAAPFYRQVVQNTALLHEKGLEKARRRGLALQRPFDWALLRWESQYFLENLGRRYLERELLNASLERDLRRICRRLLGQPEVLLHRDLQSQNVMASSAGAVLIDFQGARKGPALYDVASLLEDPYVELPEGLKRELLMRYCEARQLKTPWSLEGQDYLAAACQRLMQASGAYAFLTLFKGRTEFETFIPQALSRLAERARQGSFPALKATAEEALAACRHGPCER